MKTNLTETRKTRTPLRGTPVSASAREQLITATDMWVNAVGAAADMTDGRADWTAFLAQVKFVALHGADALRELSAAILLDAQFDSDYKARLDAVRNAQQAVYSAYRALETAQTNYSVKHVESGEA
jgi:hypothetical protein